MKQLNTCLLACLIVLLSACSADSGEETTAKKDQYLVNGSAMPAQNPPDYPEVPILVNNYWVFEHHVVRQDPEATRASKGRWYKFNPDGTYEGGQWQDKNDHGTWTLQQGEQFMHLICDSEVDDRRDAEWQLQSSSSDNAFMSWVKTRRMGDGIVVFGKLENLSTPPTKEQYGVTN